MFHIVASNKRRTLQLETGLAAATKDAANWWKERMADVENSGMHERILGKGWFYEVVERKGR